MADKCRLNVRLKPRARKSALSMNSEGNLAMSVTSPPVAGKANAEAIALLSKKLRMPKSAFAIVRGQASRDKVIAIEGLSERAVRTILQDRLTEAGL